MSFGCEFIRVLRNFLLIEGPSPFIEVGLRTPLVMKNKLSSSSRIVVEKASG
jgi:hypothetical protein